MEKETNLRRLVITEMPYNLLSFLIEHKVLSKFLDNTIYCNIKLHDRIDRLINSEGITINNSFIWRKTPQGYLFWSKLYIKYEVCIS